MKEGLVVFLMIVVLLIFLISFIWMLHNIISPSRNKTLIVKSILRTGYTEGIILNLDLQERTYVPSVKISKNKLYMYNLCKEGVYIERVNILTCPYSKHGKHSILKILEMEQHSVLYSKLNKPGGQF